MAYAAVVSLQKAIDNLVNSRRISLTPASKKITKIALHEVLFPSYGYLPQHLKPCFLHMGVFPEKDGISRSKLSSMWTAEGFLEPIKKETMKKCFEKYFKELVNHSIVIRSQGTSKYLRWYSKYADSMKTCRLQSSFWHLCMREAKNSNFFHVLSRRNHGLEENSMEGQRRLSFQNNIILGMKDVLDSVQKACASTARSLLCYGPYHPYQLPICFSLVLLKVLDVLQIRFYEFPLQALQLLYLRYIALTYNGQLPTSISKLWNLQFLIAQRNMRIKRSGVTPYAPVEIWDMKEVKHIQIMGSNLPNPSGTTSLENLSTLLGVGAETCTKEVLERVPNLTKLGIQIELHPDDDVKALDCLDHVHVLGKLSSLKFVVVNPKLWSKVLPQPLGKKFFPSSLKKLHLSGLGYPWEYMSVIGSLPLLEVLKLRCYAFRGPKWVVKKDWFQVLEYLLIEGTDLVHLRVEPNAFYNLGCLCLKH